MATPNKPKSVGWWDATVVAATARRSVAPRVMSLRGPRNTLAEAWSEIDVSYRGRRRSGKQRSVAAGDRAPNAGVGSVSGGVVDLFDVFDKERHTLMIVGTCVRDASTAAIAHYQDQVHVLHVVRDHNSAPAEGGSVLVDPEVEVGKRYCIPAGGYALVRPDGFVGALGTDGAGDLRGYLARLTALRRVAGRRWGRYRFCPCGGRNRDHTR